MVPKILSILWGIALILPDMVPSGHQVGDQPELVSIDRSRVEVLGGGEHGTWGEGECLQLRPTGESLR